MHTNDILEIIINDKINALKDVQHRLRDSDIADKLYYIGNPDSIFYESLRNNFKLFDISVIPSTVIKEGYLNIVDTKWPCIINGEELHITPDTMYTFRKWLIDIPNATNMSNQRIPYTGRNNTAFAVYDILTYLYEVDEIRNKHIRLIGRGVVGSVISQILLPVCASLSISTSKDNDFSNSVDIVINASTPDDETPRGYTDTEQCAELIIDIGFSDKGRCDLVPRSDRYISPIEVGKITSLNIVDEFMYTVFSLDGVTSC